MILHVTPENRHLHSAQVAAYFRIRKQVFYDRLNWDVVVHGDQEYDVYDSLGCHYLLALDREGTVVGGLRQMKMTGPTLTWEKFSDMIADPVSLFTNDTWETTRFAVRPQDGDIRFTIGVNLYGVELSTASLEMGMAVGARRHVAVCEEKIVRLTKTFGVPCETLGRRATPQGEDVLCVAWEVSDASLERMAWAKSRLSAAA